MKAFCRLRIPESACAKKETGDIDLLKTSKNGDRKIIQPIRIKSGPPTKMKKCNKFFFYHNNTHLQT